MSARIRFFLPLLFLEVILWGCPSSEKVPRDYGECRYPALDGDSGNGATSMPVTAGNIFLDLSTSMQGYLSDENYRISFTLLQHLVHSRLQDAFHSVDINEPAFYGFDQTIVKEVAPRVYYAIKTPNGPSPRSRYNHGQSNIVGVLLQAAKTASALSVIITDGLQDVHGINGDLSPGFDRPEFTHAVCDSLIDKGFGIWLIGIMNDFDGVYYSIIPDRNGVINNQIYVHGKRPVYCWVICKDVGKGRNFVQYLQSTLLELSKDNGTDADHDAKPDTTSKLDHGKETTVEALVQAVEIAPGLIPTVDLMEATSVPQFAHADKFLKNTVRVTDWRTHPAQLRTKNVAVYFPNAISDTVHFVLQARLGFEGRDFTWSSLPPSMWRIHLDKPGNFPLSIAEDTQPNPMAELQNLRFMGLDFLYDKLIVFEPEQRLLELPVYLDADLEKGLANHWLKKWSSQNDTDKNKIIREDNGQGKTLYLYDVVAAMLKHSIGKQRVGACLHLSLLKRAG